MSPAVSHKPSPCALKASVDWVTCSIRDFGERLPPPRGGPHAVRERPEIQHRGFPGGDSVFLPPGFPACPADFRLAPQSVSQSLTHVPHLPAGHTSADPSAAPNQPPPEPPAPGPVLCGGDPARVEVDAVLLWWHLHWIGASETRRDGVLRVVWPWPAGLPLASGNSRLSELVRTLSIPLA